MAKRMSMQKQRANRRLPHGKKLKKFKPSPQEKPKDLHPKYGAFGRKWRRANRAEP